MPLSLAGMARLDYGMLAGLAAGLVLLTAAFAAVSLFVSCLTVHPVVAAIGAFATLLGMVLAGEAAGDGLRARGWTVAASLTQVFSPIKSFEPFGKGLLRYLRGCLPRPADRALPRAGDPPARRAAAARLTMEITRRRRLQLPGAPRAVRGAAGRG